MHKGKYVTDLSNFFGDLRRVIIVDNIPWVITCQPQNHICCSDFRSDPNERELEQIWGFVVSMKDVEDMREKLGQ